MKHRCPWPGSDPLYLRYHDAEWGVPVHDDRLPRGVNKHHLLCPTAQGFNAYGSCASEQVEKTTAGYLPLEEIEQVFLDAVGDRPGA